MGNRKLLQENVMSLLGLSIFDTAFIELIKSNVKCLVTAAREKQGCLPTSTEFLCQ